MKAEFPGGAWLVELSELRDADLLANAVAQATRLTEQTLRPLLEAVCEHLAGAPLLLVLDTCEHILDECARLAGRSLGDGRLTGSALSRAAATVKARLPDFSRS